MRRAGLPAGFVAWVLIGAGWLLGGCSKNISDSNVQRVGVTEFSRQLERRPDRTLVLDVRSAAEFERGHVPGARNVRLNQIDQNERDPAFERFDVIMVYGEDPGSPSAMAVSKRLMHAGYGQVLLVEPGFKGWVAAGMPVSRPTGAGASP